ncbi:MAG TPA: type II toxin-antitoxin system HicB family antitoxin [Allocoleopsis sp.]
MNMQTLSTKADKLAVNVLIKNEQDGNVSAMVLGLPEYGVISGDRPSAMAKLEKLLTDTLSSGEVVLLELEIPKQEHPWQKFAGIYKDSELFDSVLTNMENSRTELNVEMSHNYEKKTIA